MLSSTVLMAARPSRGLSVGVGRSPVQRSDPVAVCNHSPAGKRIAVPAARPVGWAHDRDPATRPGRSPGRFPKGVPILVDPRGGHAAGHRRPTCRRSLSSAAIRRRSAGHQRAAAAGRLRAEPMPGSSSRGCRRLGGRQPAQLDGAGGAGRRAPALRTVTLRLEEPGWAEIGFASHPGPAGGA